MFHIGEGESHTTGIKAKWIFLWFAYENARIKKFPFYLSKTMYDMFKINLKPFDDSLTQFNFFPKKP